MIDSHISYSPGRVGAHVCHELRPSYPVGVTVGIVAHEHEGVDPVVAVVENHL